MKHLFYFSIVLLLTGCKQRYDSPVHSSATGYLVVDGFVNSDPAGTTIIRLSRSVRLDSANIKFEKAAQVKIEGQDNSSFTLLEGDSGRYSISNLHLNSSVNYRLNIVTSDGKQYQSDYVVVKNNPPIDSISWKRENGGLQVYVNTHDPLDTTRYYEWDYKATWQFHSAFVSVLKYVVITNNTGAPWSYYVTKRDSNPPIYYTCWQSEAPGNILLGSSAKLDKDIINLPLVFIEHASWKLSVLYSIYVRQYALTKDGYEFMERMRKNTESTGSVFDAQPSELNGNFRCITDATEPVIGYFNICPIRETRIFISNSQLPDWGYEQNCVQVVEGNVRDALDLIPTIALKEDFFSITEFYAAEPICVDCELRGTHIKPSFWP